MVWGEQLLPHNHNQPIEETMTPQIIRIQDKYNDSKIHCYKFYSNGHVYYNQGYNCTDEKYRYGWQRLLKTIGHNGYRDYYNQAVELINQ